MYTFDLVRIVISQIYLMIRLRCGQIASYLEYLRNLPVAFEFWDYIPF